MIGGRLSTSPRRISFLGDDDNLEVVAEGDESGDDDSDDDNAGIVETEEGGGGGDDDKNLPEREGGDDIDDKPPSSARKKVGFAEHKGTSARSIGSAIDSTNTNEKEELGACTVRSERPGLRIGPRLFHKLRRQRRQTKRQQGEEFSSEFMKASSGRSVTSKTFQIGESSGRQHTHTSVSHTKVSGRSRQSMWRSVKIGLAGLDEDSRPGLEAHKSKIDALALQLGILDGDDFEPVTEDDKDCESSNFFVDESGGVSYNNSYNNKNDVSAVTMNINNSKSPKNRCSLAPALHDAMAVGDSYRCSESQRERARVKLLGKFSKTEDVALNRIVFVVAAGFLIEAFTNGAFSTIGPLFIQQVFGKGTSFSGTLMTVASIFGTVFTTLVCSDKGRELVGKILPSPTNLYAVMAIISIGTCLMIVPSLPVQIISVVLAMGLNETLFTLVNEMEGAIVTEQYYLTVGPGALLFYKIVKMVVAFVTPLLFKVGRWLPYAVAGGFAVSFTLFFVWRIEGQRRRNARLVAEVINKKRMTAIELEALNLSFTTLEILSRMASVKKLRDVEHKKTLMQRTSTAITTRFRGSVVRASVVVGRKSTCPPTTSRARASNVVLGSIEK